MDASTILITAFVVMITYQSVIVWAAVKGKLTGWKKAEANKASSGWTIITVRSSKE